MKLSYPASGWLPVGAHFEWQRSDQGRDFATNWRGVVQAPGRGHCVHVLSDNPFPNGFGPAYPVVWIDTGVFGGHFWYIGHTTTRVQPGESFEFGATLSIADQGHDFNGTHGGWVELGEANGGPNGPGYPGPVADSHWFDDALRRSYVRNVPDPPLRWGDSGLRVLGMTSRLRDTGDLSRPYWHFNQEVHGAVVAFKVRHKLAPSKPRRGLDRGVVDARTDIVLAHSSAWCKKHHKKEV